MRVHTTTYRPRHKSTSAYVPFYLSDADYWNQRVKRIRVRKHHEAAAKKYNWKQPTRGRGTQEA